MAWLLLTVIVVGAAWLRQLKFWVRGMRFRVVVSISVRKYCTVEALWVARRRATVRVRKIW